jgi:hypothetical protein
MNDLNKETRRKTVAKIYLDGNNQSPEEVARELTAAIKKARKNNVTHLRVNTSYDEGDSDSLPSHYIIIEGDVQETDLEWHCRLEHEKNVLKRNIEEAQRVIGNISYYSDRIDKIEQALQKSSLRCVDCNKPESSQTSSQDTGGKTIRICHKCYEKRVAKREARETKEREKRARERR